MIPHSTQQQASEAGRTDGSLLASLIRKRNRGVRTTARGCTVRRDCGHENKNPLLYAAVSLQHPSCGDQAERCEAK